MVKKRGLGRGLDDLLTGMKASDLGLLDMNSAHEFRRLPIERLRASAFQPRQDIHSNTLQELAESIKVQGIIQPIIVRAVVDEEDCYEIIAGERRFRAAQIAGLTEVPVLIKDISDPVAFAIALIENIQREDLNPIEEASALSRLTKEFGMTHGKVAEAVGKSRTAVTNSLRLLNLDEEVKDSVGKGNLDMGHARALLSLDKIAQGFIAKKIVSRGLSVRETEKLVRRLLNPKQKVESVLNPAIERLQNRLFEKLGVAVHIYCDKKGRGKIVVHYDDLDELEALLAQII